MEQSGDSEDYFNNIVGVHRKIDLRFPVCSSFFSQKFNSVGNLGQLNMVKNLLSMLETDWKLLKI